MKKYFQADPLDSYYWGANITKNANNRKRALQEIAKLKQENKELRQQVEEAISNSKPWGTAENAVTSFNSNTIQLYSATPTWTDYEYIRQVVGYFKESGENTYRPLYLQAVGSTCDIGSEVSTTNCKLILHGLHGQGNTLTVQDSPYSPNIEEIFFYK